VRVREDSVLGCTHPSRERNDQNIGNRRGGNADAENDASAAEDFGDYLIGGSQAGEESAHQAAMTERPSSIGDSAPIKHL
jgi:hypothetical protein